MNKWIKHVSQAELEKLCAEWQSLLRLDAWDIGVSFMHHWELGEKCVGVCDPCLRTQSAVIGILYPEEFEREAFRDIEITLVHELLHVTTAWMDDHEIGKLKGHQAVAMEQVIENLANVLVGLKRAGERKFLEGQKMSTDKVIKTLRALGK